MEEKVLFKSGVTGSRATPWSLIPYRALKRLAQRFYKGQVEHQARAWNALSGNQRALADKEWLTARAEHVIDHAFKLIEKINGVRLDDGDDDAAAIAWGGIFLIEASEYVAEHGFLQFGDGSETPLTPEVNHVPGDDQARIEGH